MSLHDVCVGCDEDETECVPGRQLLRMQRSAGLIAVTDVNLLHDSQRPIPAKN